MNTDQINTVIFNHGPRTENQTMCREENGLSIIWGDRPHTKMYCTRYTFDDELALMKATYGVVIVSEA